MIRISDINLPLDYNDDILKAAVCRITGCKPTEISEIRLVKRSVDARKKDNVHFTASVEIKASSESKILRKLPKNKADIANHDDYSVPNGRNLNKRPVIVGFGPAGMFSALMSMVLQDDNGRYWSQPIFVPNEKIYNSNRISHKEYRERILANSAIECFRKPWLW